MKISSAHISKRFVQQHFMQDDNSKGLRPKTSLGKYNTASSEEIKTTKKKQRAEESKVNYYVGLRKSTTKIGEFPSERYPPQLLTEKGLTDVMTKYTSEKLKKIISIQQHIKLADPMPIVVRIFYQAPLSKTNKEEIINYEQQQERTINKQNLSEVEKRVDICTDLCRELCQNISKTNLIEILQIRGEFLTSKKEYWLNDAWEIIYRLKKVKIYGAKERAETAAYLKGATKRLINRLDTFNKAGVVGKKEAFIDQIYEIMGNHVDKAKESTGLNQALLPVPPNERSNVVFKSVRPNCPFPMSDLLNPGFKPKDLYKKSMYLGLLMLGVPSEIATMSNKEIVNKYLYDTRPKSIQKLSLPKEQYGSMLQDNLRINHIALPKKFKNFQEFRNSVTGLTTILHSARKTRKIKNDKALASPKELRNVKSAKIIKRPSSRAEV